MQALSLSLAVESIKKERKEEGVYIAIDEC